MRVLKFGGTSVGSPAAIRQVADVVAAECREPVDRRREPPVLVVVSAASKVTDMLLAAAHTAARGDDPHPAHEALVQREKELIEALSLPWGLVDGMLADIHRILDGVRMLGELTPRTLDLVASYGERMSARLVAAHLSSQGLSSRAHDAWDLGLFTDSSFGAARTVPDYETEVARAWAALPAGEVPVTTGFIAKDRQGHVTTLGRGGSDLSASLFGTAVGAEEIQIWTDVSGIMTCDPRVVPSARVVPSVSFSEAAELAYFGAKVLHPRTIEPATRAGIPVRVKNTFRPDDEGTLILHEVPGKPAGPVGLSAQKGVTTINVSSVGMLEAAGFLARVFEVFGGLGVPVDVVTTSEVSISVTVSAKAARTEEAVAALSRVARVNTSSGRSIVCLVGEGIKSTPGIAGRVFTVLGDHGINVEMISQGASQINITFVVEDARCDDALRALHAHFFES